MNTMDRILVIVGASAAVFTVVMILLYVFTGGIPDTLCSCFYSAIGCECGIMGVIKSVKMMRLKRKWQKEDGVKYDEVDDETIVE